MAEVAALTANDGRAPSGDLRRIGSHPNHWYPVAWSKEVKPGHTLGTSFAGEPIVIVRARSGSVFALEDRCAHRQVPLRFGVVTGETLRCCYHGWTYDGSGHCVDVPYLSKEQTPNGVRAYPCQENAGVIFIFPGAPERAAALAVPELSAAKDSAYKTRRFGGTVKCHYSFLHENLMDMNHQFLHRRLMGQIHARFEGSRRGPTSLEVDYTFHRSAGKRHFGEAAMFGGTNPGDRADVMTVRTEYPYQTLTIRVGDAPSIMELWIVYVPLDDAQRTNRTFGLLSIRKFGLPGAIHLAWPFICWFTERIFTQDRWVVEREQEAHDQQGADWNQEVFPIIRDLRALLTRCGTPIQPTATGSP
jgi:phenylpropionate dioxygenase-like ring-hydroxylating dioxygenase large terminal subunit